MTAQAFSVTIRRAASRTAGVGRGSGSRRHLPGRAICAVWVQTADVRSHSCRDDAPEEAVVRIREGGEVLERIEYDRAIFAAMLGGLDRKTLFLLAAEWRGIEQINEAVAARTGQVLVSQVSVPGAGWP